MLTFGLSLSITVFSKNYFKKIIALSIAQTSVILTFIMIGYKPNSIAPLIKDSCNTNFVDPLPHAFMLTAILVGIATTSVAIAIVVQIYKTKHKN